MAPDQSRCLSTTIGSASDRSLSMDDTPRSTPRGMMTPSSSNSCTPRSSSMTNNMDACSSGSMVLSLKMVKPWSTHSAASCASSAAAAGSGYGAPCIVTPRPRVSPMVSSKARDALRNLASRDKESMAEELVQLKRALLDKEQELQRRKVHATNVEAENRKLAQDIDALEVSLNLEGPRTGSPWRLRAKIAALKAMLEEVHGTCEAQALELFELRRDLRLTRTREMEVERNVYAAEVRRLQQVVKKLKMVNCRVGHENRVVGRLKVKNHHLEVMNLRLSSCLSASLSQTPRTARQFDASASPRTPLSDLGTVQPQDKGLASKSNTPRNCLPT